MTSARHSERLEARRRTGIAFLLSLLLHLVAILTVAWFYLAVPTQPAPPPDEAITLTLVEPPASDKPSFIETSAPESAAPDKTSFESDHNTAEASPEAATAPTELPTQPGRDQPFLELETQQLALAKPTEAPPAPAAPPSAAPAEASRPEQAQLPPREEIKPKPETGVAVAVAKEQRDLPEEKKQQPPPALPSSPPSYRRQARATRLSGNVSNRGRASLASLNTPLGRYRKAISDAIGSSWYYYIGSRMDMFSLGSVTVLFNIDKNGKARNPRVLSNTSNESFEIVTIESIRAAEIPPIPPDVLPTLEGGQIEIDFTFSIISY